MNASRRTPPTSSATQGPMLMPTHWTPEQALAVFECLQLLREALWTAYGPQVQRAWREQLVTGDRPPQFDPDDPF